MTSASPSAWILRHAALVPPAATVLDLACGSGRHARRFAAAGHPVLAVDRDAAALATLAGVPGLETLGADLEGPQWPLVGRRFDAVVVVNYLWRPRLGDVIAAVAAGGLLLYETFAHGNAAFGRPSNPDWLLRPGELLDAVRGELEVLRYEHGRSDSPGPRIVQRIVARRGDPAEVRLD